MTNSVLQKDSHDLDEGKEDSQDFSDKVDKLRTSVASRIYSHSLAARDEGRLRVSSSTWEIYSEIWDREDDRKSREMPMRR